MAAAGQLAAGVLPYQDIRDLCGFAETDEDDQEPGGPPIRGSRKGNLKTAGYDLRLGAEYYRRDDPPPSCEIVRTKSLGDGESIVIESNQVVVVSMHETLKLDRSTIGRISLKMDLLRQGLIMASQSQIDAAYEGGIFVLLYNLSDRPVSIKRGESVLRLELIRLPKATDKPYRGDYRNKALVQALKDPLSSSLAHMRKSVEASETRVIGAEQRVDAAERRVEKTENNARRNAVGLTVVAIAIPVLLYFFGGVRGDIDDLEKSTARLEGPSQIPSEKVIERQNQAIDALNCKIKKLESKQPRKVKC